VDKNFESTYEHLSEPRNVHIISGKCGQKHEIMDKNMKLWTNISSLLMNIQVNPECVFHVFVYNFMFFVHNFLFLSTFSRKLYEHLNMFIRIGHVSWHLLNMFLGIFVTILLFFISTNQNHFKIKKTKLYYFQSQPKSTKP
jgi:hypothetical protein